MGPTASRKPNIAACSVRIRRGPVASLSEIGAALQQPNRERDNHQDGHEHEIERDRR